MVVEDDALVQAILVNEAERAGFEAEAAGSAREALALARTRRFDLAVLDYRLPDGNGIELAETFHRRGDPPFLLFSAYADDAIVRRATELGALGYLVKPVDPGTLGPMLKTACARGAEHRRARAAVVRARAASARRAIDLERRRLAAELHDGLGQELTGISLLAVAIERDMRRTGHAVHEDLAHLRQLLRETQEHCRTLAHKQYGATITGRALGRALHSLAQREGALSGIECIYRGPLRPRHAVPDDVSHHLYRVAQEAIGNAVRHSGGTRITIRLDLRPDEVMLTVRDNGRGLPADGCSDDCGIGCRTMSLRAKSLGGVLTIREAPPSGTEVLVRVPLPRPAGRRMPAPAR
jgi:signal transduction histidine kinase